jgi:hypothetical protein
LSVAAPGAQPTLAIARDAAGVKISWEADITGYTLQTTATLGGGQWASVPGVSNNSVIVPTSGTAAFYRLFKQ